MVCSPTQHPVVALKFQCTARTRLGNLNNFADSFVTLWDSHQGWAWTEFLRLMRQKNNMLNSDCEGNHRTTVNSLCELKNGWWFCGAKNRKEGELNCTKGWAHALHVGALDLSFSTSWFSEHWTLTGSGIAPKQLQEWPQINKKTKQ